MLKVRPHFGQRLTLCCSAARLGRRVVQATHQQAGERQVLERALRVGLLNQLVPLWVANSLHGAHEYQFETLLLILTTPAGDAFHGNRGRFASECL